jgi:hypothetical protein
MITIVFSLKSKMVLAFAAISHLRDGPLDSSRVKRPVAAPFQSVLSRAAMGLSTRL